MDNSRDYIKRRRVVVTGMGALTPIGNNVDEFWNSLKSGKSGGAPLSYFDTEHFKTKFACEIKGFDASEHFDRKEMRKMDRYCHYALYSVKEALAQSSINLESVDLDRFGVIWASGNGGIQTFEEQLEDFYKNDEKPRFNPFFIPRMIADTAAGLISIKYGLRGINFCTVSACASSTHALIDAVNYIRWGYVDQMIAGGSEAPITRASVGGFSSMKALSTRNDDPATASRPFAADRDGFVIGEGAGALVLEEYESAKARGANILAEIVGGGMSADAYHMTATHPEGTGAALSMSHAIKDAGIQAEEIDYINMHATSTPAGDPSELKAAQTVFGDHAHKLNISATKSMTGHLLGAAGAVEAIASILAVQHDLIPPTINTEVVDPELPKGMNLTLGEAQSRKTQYALSNTFGFGGHNASVIVKRNFD